MRAVFRVSLPNASTAAVFISTPGASEDDVERLEALSFLLYAAESLAELDRRQRALPKRKRAYINPGVDLAGTFGSLLGNERALEPESFFVYMGTDPEFPPVLVDRPSEDWKGFSGEVDVDLRDVQTARLTSTSFGFGFRCQGVDECMKASVQALLAFVARRRRDDPAALRRLLTAVGALGTITMSEGLADPRKAALQAYAEAYG